MSDELTQKEQTKIQVLSILDQAITAFDTAHAGLVELREGIVEAKKVKMFSALVKLQSAALGIELLGTIADKLEI